MTDKPDERKAVPREPTEAIVKAMLREITKVGGWINNDSLAAVWRAAFDAAPSQSIPQEATDGMYHAGMKEIAAAVDADAMPSPFVVWRAMFDAAPVLATAPAEPQNGVTMTTTASEYAYPERKTPAPQKDGEVAALIERLHAAYYSLAKYMQQQQGRLDFELSDRFAELAAVHATVADALARLSQQVADLNLIIDNYIRDIAALEGIRPTWAQGYTSDSIAAQTTAAALATLWKLLGVDNQTDAVARLSAPVPARKWIPVGERLPEQNCDVLVYSPQDGIWIDSYGHDDLMAPCWQWAAEKTHWTPLPPPPAADK